MVELHCDLCQPQAKGEHLFFQVSQQYVSWCNCFTFAPKHTNQNKHSLEQDASSLYTSHKESKTVSGQRQTDWLARVPGVSLPLSHTHTVLTLTQAGRHPQTHTPSYPPKQAAWIEVLIKIKTKKTRLLLSAVMDIKSVGHPEWYTHTLTHTQRVRKTTQLPPFSQSGNSGAFCCSRIKPWMGGSVTNSPPSVVPLGGGGSPRTLWYHCLCSFSRPHFVGARIKADTKLPIPIHTLSLGWVSSERGGGPPFK